MASIESMIAGLRQQGVKGVVFDFDCTITLRHSGGRVKKEKIAPYLVDNISPTFHQLLPRLLEENFRVGVATFADSFKCPATHVGGEDLVRVHFKHYMGDELRDKVAIVAKYPENYQSDSGYKAIGLSAPMPQSKEYHLGILCREWNMHSNEVALVDDDIKNIDAAHKDGHPVRFVRQRKGLMPEDMQP